MTIEGLFVGVTFKGKTGMAQKQKEVVAYYLGQYHPIQENNVFWGDGFTEWHNVARARPLFPGHVQPKLPGALGFYDLRCEETLIEQMRIAKEVGITAFCYWHYWFAGRRLLHDPLDRMLSLVQSGAGPRMKFMLGWANESWSGVWHGANDRILIEQTYNSAELDEHAATIASYIRTGNYLRINGQYPIVIYKPRKIPNAIEYLGALRNAVERYAHAHLYIIGNWGPGNSEMIKTPADYGLDAVVISPVGAHIASQLLRFAYQGLWYAARKVGIGPELRRYSSIRNTLLFAQRNVRGISHATIVTGWDNTPRSGRGGLILVGYNKDNFVKAAVTACRAECQNQYPLLFVKSWNEWAEGNVVEAQYREKWSVAEALKKVLCDEYYQRR